MVDRWLFAWHESRLPVGFFHAKAEQIQERFCSHSAALYLSRPKCYLRHSWPAVARFSASGYETAPPEEIFMKAYAIAAETVKDQAMFDRYRSVVPETLTAFGGHFVVRGGNLTVLEGEWPHPRLVIIEFPSRAAAEGWYRSAEYQKVISLRLNSSVGNLIIVDGSP